jgi:uncharacterized membrane protein YfcA
MTWEFSVAGLLVGVLVGMTGMGGGSLMTPILILLFGFDAKAAVGTDILHGAVFKSFGAARHRMLGTVHARLALWMFAGSAPMSLVGVELADQLGDGASKSMARLVGAALIVGGIGFLAKTFLHSRATIDAPFLLTNRDRAIAVAMGAFGGLIVGLTSVGSGTFFGLTMLLVYPLAAQKIVGTDVFHAAILLWVAGASHLLHGNVDTHALAWLLVGSIPGVLIGSNLSVKVPEQELRVAFGVVLLLSGIKVLEVPGATPIVFVGVIASALGFLAWSLRRVLARRPLPAPD